MRVAIILLLVTLVAYASAQTLCDKYAQALNLNGSALISTVVNGAVSSVVANSITKRYFDGSLYPYQDLNATNYLDPNQAGALAHLVGNLDTFFYAALGCSDKSLGPYTGRSMQAAHALLPIGVVQFESFNRQVLAVLNTAGVTAADQATILGVLNGQKSAICNQPSCVTQTATGTICDRYSAALNLTGYDLMDAVVSGVLANITSATVTSPLRHYFDGSIAGEPNFITNTTAYTALRAHLDQFFGMTGVLSCSGTFPAYAGKSLVAAHAHLGIGLSDFNLFNTIVLNTMQAAGVAAADLTTVNGVLVSTKSAICTLCNNSTTTTTTTSSSSGTSTTTNAASGLTAFSSVVVMFVSALALYMF